MPQQLDPWVSHRRGLWTFARELVESTMKSERTPQALFKLIGKLNKLLIRETEAYDRKATLVQGPNRQRPACRAGCWFCCAQPVGAAIPEILRIAETIKETWSEEEQAALRERIEGYKRAANHLLETGKVGEVRLVHVCPLLKNQMCSLWEIRPTSCRGYNSFDVSFCERLIKDPKLEPRVPSDLPQVDLAESIKGGLLEGLDRSGLSDYCDLSLGLDVALKEPDVTERYLAGEPVFAEAMEMAYRLHPEFEEGDRAPRSVPKD